MKPQLPRGLVGLLSMLCGLLMLACSVCARADIITYYHNDLLGSPRLATDQTGHVLWEQDYFPYGERMSPSVGTNKIWYTSRHQDDDTSLVYMGARYYDPLVGRFVSVDPRGFDLANIQSHNRYNYANNNPYRYFDPTGKGPEALTLCAAGPAGCAAGAVLAIATTYYGAKAIDATIRALNSYNESNEDKPSGSDKPSLVDPDRETHILEGDKTSGGHRAGSGKPGKSEFPSNWSDERILGEVSDVATDPKASRSRGRGGREVVRGSRDGVDIEVIVDSNGRIVTGYPTNRPRNPE